MSLPPDPKLFAYVDQYKARKSFALPIPSSCSECSMEFPSKTTLAQHDREIHPKEPPFDDGMRERFLAIVREDPFPIKAARKIGISPHTLKRAMKVDPSFAEAVTLAEEEASEVAEQVLWNRMKAEDPWAVNKWLTKRSKERWSDDKNININVSGVIEHREGLLPHEQDILALRDTIRERARLNGTPLALENTEIIDAEIID